MILLYIFVMEKISKMISEDYKAQMKSLLEKDYEKYIKSLDDEPVRALRVNTKKIGIEEFLANNKNNLKLEKISFANDAFLFETDGNIGFSDEFLSGQIYVQEPSSMIAVCASEIEKEKRALKVLDLCSAPGGKTSQIACRVSEDSIIFANEIIRNRADILQSNIERQGFKNVVVLNEEPKDLLYFKGFFDYVFVDAPCSGEGMFRKNPGAILEWSKDNVEMCASRQKEILEIAQRLLAEDGKLVYSTCTFNEKEDEEIVKWLIEEFGFELLDVSDEIKGVTISSRLGENLRERARKFLPYKSLGEGQFVAVLRKTTQAEKSSLYSKKHGKCIVQIGQSENKLVLEFSKGTLKEDFSWRNLFLVGNNVFCVPKAFDGDIRTALESLKFVLVGVKIGSIEKNRFEPNHNLFMAFESLFKTKIELSDEELKKYLYGEEIIRSEPISKGYAVVTRNGYSVGGVKISNGRLKNLYPKGLRIPKGLRS